jgi:hypothetical protein
VEMGDPFLKLGGPVGGVAIPGKEKPHPLNFQSNALPNALGLLSVASQHLVTNFDNAVISKL